MSGIELRNLSFSQGEQEIFSKLSFSFEEGHFILLTGDSGAGKSTLMRLIAQYEPLAYEGEITVIGQDVRQLNYAKRGQLMSMMFQNPDQQFTMGTLKKEMIFALENLNLSADDIDIRMEKAIETLNTKTLLNRDLHSLSGGEKQRVTLTVILAMDPDVILLDEPFASVDPKNRKIFIQLLGKLRDLGKTILLSDHDYTHYDKVIDDWVLLENKQLKLQEKTKLREDLETPHLSQKNYQTSEIWSLTDFTLSRENQTLIQLPHFQFKKGITTLTGANGTGKSSLFKAMIQRLNYEGKMAFNGSTVKKNHLYDHLTLVVQQASQQFIGLTPKEEFAFNQGELPDAKDWQSRAMKDLGLSSREESSLYHLSGGQQKAIQLITMLSLDVELLLLDEPFVGLDLERCEYFMKRMAYLAKEKGKSFIIISHRFEPLNGYSHYHVHLENQQLKEVDDYA